jgi:hypothetical protein
MIFLTKTRLRSLLYGNTKYYSTFTRSDMTARRIKSIRDYLSIISKSVSEFTQAQKKILEESASKADKILTRIRLPGFDGAKAARMRWKIGCISGRKYEGGFPHTVGGTIILPDNVHLHTSRTLVRLLIHEKVHIYQRKYKADIKVYLQSHNFTPLYRRKNSRANPDLNSIIYYNTKTDRKYESNYRSSRPRSVSDIKNTRYEHPYEEMAYSIEKMN